MLTRAARLIIALVVAIASLVIAGCGGDGNTAATQSAAETAAAPSGPDAAAGPVMVTIERFSITDGAARATGTASVPDGALVVWEMAPVEVTTLGYTAEGEVPVEGGAFVINEDLTGWPTEPVELWVAFQIVTEQPQDIIDIYGTMGENITGPDVSTTGDAQRVEATAVSTPR